MKEPEAQIKSSAQVQTISGKANAQAQVEWLMDGLCS